MRKSLFIILALHLLTACSYKPDNPVEELTEKVIKRRIGVDVDLSPRTPEKH